MRIAGIALGGLIPNLTRVAEFLNKREGAGLIPAGLLGTATQHPEAAFMYHDIYGYFVGRYKDLHTRVMQRMYNVDGYMGYHGVPGMPVFIYNAIDDELSDITAVDELVERFCGVGATILYHRNTAGTYSQALVNGWYRAFAWLSSVLDGNYDQVYSNMGCTILNVTYDLAPYIG
ncbi:hypothetical protein MFIFM68171_09407 [Madurella fahalii]|uniref:Uncharacterized protein n=1 Tax=Madurella fahalii TaxID=1157608 RepID=A0ABQ0GN49_9PEZI